MKEVVVLSGKGGTGKTSVVASLAVLAGGKVLADCDVDAADLHLLLRPQDGEDSTWSEEFWSGRVAEIDAGKCACCGLCQDLCRFGAVSVPGGEDHARRINPLSCEGCGFCFHACPAKAIMMKDNLAGHLFVSRTTYGSLVHARLGIAQENSGKLVARVREKARELASEEGAGLVIVDGPPGTGCPVISSLSGASLALLVTEPTLTGMHDLERVIGVCRHFGVPAMVCINKHDINQENAEAIEHFCSAGEVPVAARIGFDNVVTEALVKGVPVVEYSTGRVSQEMEKLWKAVLGFIQEKVRG